MLPFALPATTATLLATIYKSNECGETLDEYHVDNNAYTNLPQ